jgi:opacity protein-like surface antigen
MRSTFLTAALLGAVVLGAGEAAAQTPRSSSIIVKRGEFSVAPYGGYLVSQAFVEGPLNSSLGVVSSPVYGVQASLPLAPGASLVGALGYSSGDLEVGLPILGGIGIGNSSTWMFDASVELRLDSWQEQGKRFVPLAQLGGGAFRREVTVAGISARTTDFVVSGGVGADFPITNNVAVRVMGKDHYGKADFGTVGPLSAKTNDFHTLAITAGLRIAF